MRNLIGWKKSIPISVQSPQRNPFSALQAELDKAMRDFSSVFEIPGMSLRNFENLTISPSIDIVEDKDNFKVEAEMPGLGEEDIKVMISDGLLTIKGEKTTSKQDKDKNYISREIDYGFYERTIALPDTVDVDKAKASFKKGMLWVVMPKKTEAIQRSREISVEKVSDNEKKSPSATKDNEVKSE